MCTVVESLQINVVSLTMHESVHRLELSLVIGAQHSSSLCRKVKRLQLANRTSAALYILTEHFAVSTRSWQ